MNPLLRALRQGTSVAAPPPPPTSSGLMSSAPIGINVSGIGYYYSAIRGLVNVIADGDKSWYDVTKTNPITPDVNGWPTQDFSVVPHWVATGGSPESCLGSFTGWADTISSLFGSLTISAKTYDAGTNTTTFTVTYPAAQSATFALAFSGTRRTGGAAGAINTGLTNVVMAMPGYSVADIAGKVITDEFRTYLSQFKCLRMMDMIGVISDVATVNWADVRRRATTHLGVTYDDCIDMANKCNTDVWWCIPINMTDAAITSLVDFIDAGLNPGQKCYLEYVNETWNYAQVDAHNVLKKALPEIKGLVGGEAVGYGIAALTRSANVVTMTANFDLAATYGWAAGTVIYFTGDGVAGSPYTLLSCVGAVCTFTKAGADGAIGIGSSTWVASDFTGTLNAYDHNTNVYTCASRWAIRRTMQISTVVRARVGDAKMGAARFRMVWAEQLGKNDGSAYLNYLASVFPAHPVNYYLYGHSEASYFYNKATRTNAAATVADVVADLAANARNARDDYNYEQRQATCIRYGLKNLWYESGVDTMFSANGPEANVRNRASMDPGIKAGIKDMLADWFRIGGDLACWYHSGLIDVTSQNIMACWGVTDAITNLAAPKLAAMAETQASGVALDRNVLALAIGTPTDVTYNTSAPHYDAPGWAIPGPYDTTTYWTVTTAEAGTWSVVVTYAALNTKNVVVACNGVPVGNFNTITDAGNAGTFLIDHVSAPFSVPLQAGVNVISLDVGNTFAQVNGAFKKLTLTRTA